MRASRLLSILILLQLRERLSAAALATEFGVSQRTIYRDVDRLAASGVPIYAERGPAGGFRLVAGYRTRLTGLGAEEAEALFMIGLPGPARALGMHAAAGDAGRKLLAALPRGFEQRAGRMGDRFFLDAVDWYRDEDPLPQLPALARAVLDQHELSMEYESWTGLRHWRVQPLGLVLKAGSWYLVAVGRGKPRMFKVANMRHHEIDRSKSFARPADFELSSWWRAEIQRFESSLRTERTVLLASTSGCKRLAELGAYARRAVAAGQTDESGRTRLELPFEHLDQAAHLLLGLGAEITVLAPVALRDRMYSLALAVAERYAPASQPEFAS